MAKNQESVKKKNGGPGDEEYDVDRRRRIGSEDDGAREREGVLVWEMLPRWTRVHVVAPDRR